MRTDAGIKANAFNDRLCVQSLCLRVGVQLIEIAHAHGEIGVSEELDRLRFCGMRDAHRNLRLLRAFAQELGK